MNKFIKISVFVLVFSFLSFAVFSIASAEEPTTPEVESPVVVEEVTEEATEEVVEETPTEEEVEEVTEETVEESERMIMTTVIEESTATIVATKIVCNSETDLPNWGAGGADITSTTADDFLASHPNCHEDPNWKFAWSENGVGNPGDNTVGTLGNPWHTFTGSTEVPAGSLLWVREEFQDGYLTFNGIGDATKDTSNINIPLFECNPADGGQTCATDYIKEFDMPANGKASASYEIYSGHCSSIRFNVYVDGTLVNTTPFLGWVSDPDNRPMSTSLFSDLMLNSGQHEIRLKAEGVLGGCNIGNLVSWGGDMILETETIPDFSAELYCHTDVLNYDNWDWINPIEAGNTYNCVGFNVSLNQEEPLSECSDGLDNDGDGLSDMNDPGCHTDGDVNNTSSYDQNDNDEKNPEVCRAVVSSDTMTKVNGNNNSILAWDEHPAWTAIIPGASWIWDTYRTENPTLDETKFFSRTFYMPVNMTQAYLMIASDNEYKVSINSFTNVFSATDSNDAVDHNFTSTGQDFYDALPYLVSGTNTITFEVKNLALENGTVDNNPAGLLYSLEILNENCGSNLPPVANAGTDQTLTLPTNSTTLNGSLSSDADGTIVSYAWTQVSGPSVVDPANVMNYDISNLVVGTYVFQLIVTDNDGAFSTADTVTIVVNPQDGDDDSICSDGLDNDGDKLIDFPEDPGCESSTDDSEDDRRILGGGGVGIRRGSVLGAQDTVCDFAIDTYMRRGYNNDKEQVKILQGLLNKYVEAGLTVDGFYGPQTEKAVNAFQIKYRDTILDPWNIENPTGIFFRTSLVQAQNLECPDPELPIPENLINWSQSRGEVPAIVPVRIPLSLNYYYGI